MRAENRRCFGYAIAGCLWEQQQEVPDLSTSERRQRYTQRSFEQKVTKGIMVGLGGRWRHTAKSQVWRLNPATTGKRFSIEHRDRLDLRSLRKHVERLDGHDLISASQSRQIAGEGGWIAGDINQAGGRMNSQCIGYAIVHAVRGGIKEHGVRLLIDQDGFNCFADVPTNVCLIRTRRFPCGVDWRLVPIDADDALDSVSQGVPKKSRAAIGVDQHLADDPASDKIKERIGNEIIGLGESAGRSRCA